MDKNSDPNLSVVVLAAGKGKRMNNPDLAKVMARISNKPLIGLVLDVVNSLNPEKTIVVVGHCKESVIEYIKSRSETNIFFAEQNQQLGTGHAVAQAESFFSGYEGSVLILAGDVPLLTADTLIRFSNDFISKKAAVSVLTTIAPDPTGYGRIIRNTDGSFLKIVEHKDATDDERLVKEINSGIFIVNSALLFDSLKSISNKNSQGEYYLTDIVEILQKAGQIVIGYPGANFDELQGVNTVEDLARAESQYLKLK